MISFRLDASKFENLYKKLLPTISTFSYVSGQTKQVCPTVQPIRHTRHDYSFTIRAWTDISKTGLKRSNLNFNSIRHWYQSLLYLSNYIILSYLSNCKRFQLKLVPIFMRFYRWFKGKKRGWDKSPSLSIIFGLSSKTQWLSGTTKRLQSYSFCSTPYFDCIRYALCILAECDRTKVDRYHPP